MKKKEKPISYEILKKDFIFVNVLCISIGLLTFLYMVIQRVGLIPEVPCVFHDVFHMYCPGCGGTRALFALLHGNLLESIWCNPAILLGALLVLYYELGVLLTLWRKNGKRYYSTSLLLPVLYLVVVLIFSLVRNYVLLAYEFDMLKDFLP